MTKAIVRLASRSSGKYHRRWVNLLGQLLVGCPLRRANRAAGCGG